MFWIIFGIGFLLRFWQLDAQILWDDEWHAVINVRDFSLWSNATHFRESDNCTPLTIFYLMLATRPQFMAKMDIWRDRAPPLSRKSPA